MANGRSSWVKQSGKISRQGAVANLNAESLPSRHRNASFQLGRELEDIVRQTQPSANPFMINNLEEENPAAAEPPLVVVHPIEPIEPLVQPNKETKPFAVQPASFLREEEKHLPLAESIEEIQPLIRREPQPPLYQRAGQAIARNAKAVVAQYQPFVSQLTENKFATFIAILASLTATVQAFANAYRTSTSKLSLSLIRSNSNSTLVNAIVSAYSALHVNVPFNLSFLLSGRKKIMTALKTMIKRIENFIGYGILLIFGLCAAAASAALTYATFLFLPIIVSVIQGLQSFIMNWTSRLTGLITAYQTLSNVFRHSARARRDIIDAFNHLNSDAEFEMSLADFEEEFGLTSTDLSIPGDEAADLPNRRVKRTTGDILKLVTEKHVKNKLEKKREALQKELSKARDVTHAALDTEQVDPLKLNESTKTLKEISAKLEKGVHLDDVDHERIFGELVKCLMKFDKLPQDPNHPLYKSRHWSEYALYYTHTMAQITLGVIGGGVTAAIFAQNGFNAINYVSQWTTGNNLSYLDVWTKRGMGIASGIGPGTLYAISIALSLQHYATTLPLYFWRNKSEFAPLFCLLVTLITQYFASNSPRSIARNAVIQPNNILGVLASPSMQNTTETIMQVAGGMTNFAPMLRSFAHHFNNKDKPTVAEIIGHFADVNGHKTDNYTNDLMIMAANQNCFFPRLAAPKGPHNPHKKKRSQRDEKGERLTRDESLLNLVGTPASLKR